MTTHGSTVFVLDDDPAILDSYSVLFDVMEFPAEYFSTVGEFLDVYDPLRPGCIVLDLRIPGDGFELLRRLSNLDCPQPIIVVTGHGDQETRDKAMELGAALYFEKPCNNQSLCESISQFLQSTAEAR